MVKTTKVIHFEHAQDIKWDIKLESVEKCGDVKNGMISVKVPRVLLKHKFSHAFFFVEH
jgi:hypothetical protein